VVGQSINVTFECEEYILERGRDQEKKESASERRKCKSAVANNKRELVKQ
jgi:hypothetical protein